MIRAQTKNSSSLTGWRPDGGSNQRLLAATRQMLGEIWTYAEFARAAMHSAEVESVRLRERVWFPNGGPLAALPRRPANLVPARSSPRSSR